MIPRKYKFSVICDGCQNIPIYCLKRAQNEYISQEECDKLNKDFPKHTHALIINEEEDFLENIRYSLKNKAFAHEVFYSDKFTTDYIQFLLNGDSDIMFYKSRVKRPLLYYDMEVKLFENVNTTTIRIDESNAYKTMFHKGEFFRYQNEYRIVLPYERITNGKIYKVEPFNAKLVKIKDMVKHY